MSIKIDNIDEKFIGVVLGSAKNINDMNSKITNLQGTLNTLNDKIKQIK